MGEPVSYRVEQRSTAAPATVYDVLMDFDRWSEWAPTVSAASWENRGASGSGAGGVRRVRVGLSVTRDRIVAAERPHHHAYEVALPWIAPVKDYAADVRIENQAAGSLIVWAVTCTPRIPGTHRLIEFGLRTTYTRVVKALAREAERAGR
jgi:hypothetical protein